MQKKTLYIHIGMGKTGTTALQQFFWENRAGLASIGIDYPKTGIQSSAHHLLSPHAPQFLQSIWSFIPVEDWGIKLSKTKMSKVLISSELMAWAKPELIERFCAELSKTFDVKVVVYLRRQDNIIMASYNQQVKAGAQKRDLLAILESQLSMFDYSEKLRPWEEAVGVENIIVRPYERQQFYSENIIKDFLYHVFGVTQYRGFKFQDKNSNPRLNFTALEYKRILNNIEHDKAILSEFNNMLLKYSQEHDQLSNAIYNTMTLLSPEVRCGILDKCRETNEMIARKYLHRDDGVLFREALSGNNEVWEERSIDNEEMQEITRYIKENDKVLSGRIDQLLNMDESYNDYNDYQRSMLGLFKGQMN